MADIITQARPDSFAVDILRDRRVKSSVAAQTGIAESPCELTKVRYAKLCVMVINELIAAVFRITPWVKI